MIKSQSYFDYLPKNNEILEAYQLNNLEKIKDINDSLILLKKKLSKARNRILSMEQKLKKVNYLKKQNYIKLTKRTKRIKELKKELLISNKKIELLNKEFKKS